MAALLTNIDSVDQADYGGLSDEDDDVTMQNASADVIADNAVNSSSDKTDEEQNNDNTIHPNPIPITNTTPSNNHTPNHIKSTQKPIDALNPRQNIIMKDVIDSKNTASNDTISPPIPGKDLEYDSKQEEESESEEIDGYIAEDTQPQTQTQTQPPPKSNKRKLPETAIDIETETEPKRKRQRRNHSKSASISRTKRDINTIKATLIQKSHKTKQNKTKIIWNTSKRNTANHVINDSDTNDDEDDDDRKDDNHKHTQIMDIDHDTDTDNEITDHDHDASIALKRCKDNDKVCAKSKRKEKKDKKKEKRSAKDKEDEVKKIVVPKTERIPRRNVSKSRASGTNGHHSSPSTHTPTPLHPEDGHSKKSKDKRREIKKELEPSKRHSCRSYDEEGERSRHRVRERERGDSERERERDRTSHDDRDRDYRYKHRNESENDNITGLWIRDEETKFVLYEDFKSGDIIGFMRLKGETVSVIRGLRRQDHCYDIQQIFYNDRKVLDHIAKLSTDFRKIELTKIGTDTTWTLKLRNKRDIPDHLFHELEQLKKHSRFGQYRYESRRFHHPRYPPNGQGHGHGHYPHYPMPHAHPPNYPMPHGPPHGAPHGAHGYQHHGHGHAHAGYMPPYGAGHNMAPMPPHGIPMQAMPMSSHVVCKDEKVMKDEHGHMKGKHIDKKSDIKRERETKLRTKKGKVIDVTSLNSPSPSLSPPVPMFHNNNDTKDIGIAPPDISPLLSPMASPNSTNTTNTVMSTAESVVIISDKERKGKDKMKERERIMKGRKKKKKKEKERRKRERKDKHKKKKKEMERQREREKGKAKKKIFEAVTNEFRKYKEKYNSESKLYKQTIKKCSQRVQERYKDKKSTYNAQTAKVFLQSNRNQVYIEKLVQKYVQSKDAKDKRHKGKDKTNDNNDNKQNDTDKDGTENNGNDKEDKKEAVDVEK